MTKQEFIFAALEQTLTQEQVNWLFAQPETDIETILVDLAKRNDWSGFTSDFEQKIDKLCNSDQAWVRYMQYYICTVNTEARPWKIRNLSPYAQVRVLGMSGIAHLIGEYAKHHQFCGLALETLFENETYFRAYVSCRKLPERYELEMIKRISVDSPVLEEYMTKYVLSPKVQNVLLLRLLQEHNTLSEQVISMVPVRLGAG